MKAYDHKKIEKKWQKIWDKEKINEAKDPAPAGATKSAKPKFYALIEFPFPSGDGIHVGHLRSNTAMDIIARKRRAEGFDVLYPIGWDAFGLPTENYAIKTGQQPKVVTKKNTDNFRRQLKSAGFSFDWSREINTTDPGYYTWTQWIFLQFFKHDLAYKKKMVVNWCPKDKIVLANEEVINGCCERCGTPVEKREKEQWMLAITKYADRLDKDLDTVDYVEKIKIQQRNWIGKSEGSEINFKLVTDKREKTSDPAITVFTTRADTLFGATYLVVAPEHKMVKDLIKICSNKDEVLNYIEQAKKKSTIERTDTTQEKTGVELKGLKAINPANGEEIPVWVADYVLADYGTGAIMAVPAHDERDWEFAKKYHLPIRQVIEPFYIQTTEPGAYRKGETTVARNAIIAIIKHWSENKYIGLRWKKVAWRTFLTGGIEKGQTPQEAAIREIREETGYVHPKFIKELGMVHSLFYHVPKKSNRLAHGHILYFELQDGERETITVDEESIHDIEWLTADEFATFLTPETHTYALDLFKNNLKPFTGTGVLMNSGKFVGRDSEAAKKAITEFVRGEMVTTYKLRDWVFSRQRYWGEPIPMIYCEACAKKDAGKAGVANPGWVPVPEKDLPVKLPEVKKYQPTDTGESPLASDEPAMKKWRSVQCPKCGGAATRETDTMPNWAGSSWYFLRYADPENKKELASPKKLAYWMGTAPQSGPKDASHEGVDWYNGGMEHTTLHLLYSRFWNKFLFDIGVTPTSEPYHKRTSHGIILAPDGEKMSKSRGNVVNPDSIIENVGADTLRLYEMFMGPFDQTVAWNTDGIVGPRRFLERVWRLQEKLVKKAPFDASLESLINKTIAKVSEDIEAMGFNTAISSMMILVNEMEKKGELAQAYYEHLLKLLAPFAPHITEEMWQNLGHKTSIHLEKWQKADPSKLQQTVSTIVVQINGRVRGSFSAEATITENEAKEKALKVPGVEKWLENKPINKVIFVPGRIINIVAK